MSAAAGEQITADYLRSRAEYLEGVYPGIVLPDPDRVRYVERGEYPQVIAECLTEQGFPAIPNDDGGVTFDPVPPDAQAEAQSVASYACDVMYPVDPASLRPMTSEQLHYLYAYSKLKLIPCLADAGAAAPELPSEQEFTETFQQAGGWDPYATAKTMGPKAAEIAEACPAVPAELGW
ncbi:hypothetical protein ACGGZK_07005 [Agromyces sp. MMS24-K17]|uniref:hypothetical protein n=1 Tax=Agromyces sp. MMS24-K17 TaxID=3372850 RepID=UPI003754A694